MFLARRDLAFAQGRFALMTAVVTLICVLVGFLTGLAGGLAQRSVAAVVHLPADRIVLAKNGSTATWTDSRISDNQLTKWQSLSGVSTATPLGITQTQARKGDTESAIAIFGSDVAVTSLGVPSQGNVIISQTIADSLGLKRGDSVEIGSREFTVQSVGDNTWYNHSAVVAMGYRQWRETAARMGQTKPTALLVRGTPDWQAVDRAVGTESATPWVSVRMLPTFESEIGSLALIIVLLLGISSLVVGAFFTVWTIQRRHDIGVLRALGATTKALRRDALGQAGVILGIGIGTGLVIVTIAGYAIRPAMPFAMSWWTTLAPGALLGLLGLAGAAMAIRSMSNTEPEQTLGPTR
ncbi:FtsX-like permease family protein [Cutibacterium sp. WCA-380-WT-3A]|uniref:FtsX-like permease family protein n=2 Tax=Cutibacterium porci TaxID=2605781 RepID=A0A7K0J6M6_9ACTN|nr:FtsX-like permease family protein [Cutibacterium porci]